MANDPKKQGDQNQDQQQGNPEEAPVPARKQPMRDTVTGEPAEGGDQQQGDGKQAA